MTNTQTNSDLFMAALSLAIQRRRHALGLSQEEVAQRSGLHRTYISELECHSRNFSVRSYLKLVGALDLLPSELMKAAELLACGEECDDAASKEFAK